MLRSISDYVFVTIDRETNEDTGVKGYGGQSIILDTSYEPEQHAQQFATAAVVPSKMSNRNYGPEPFEKYCNIDPIIKVGDKLWCEYKPFYEEANPYRYVVYEGKRYYRLPYFQIFAVLRGDEVIPVGSWVIAEILDETEMVDGVKGKSVNGLFLPGDYKKVDVAKVKYIGTPLKGQPKLPIEAGDIVALEKNSHYENKLNDTCYYLFRQEQILGVYN